MRTFTRLTASGVVLLVATAAVAENGPATVPEPYLGGLEYRMIGPHRGGRVTAVTGVIQDDRTFYMGATGGGVWKTTDAGAIWRNVSDGFFATGSIGAIDVADSDPNVVFAGTGSACIRSNVITGRGIYRSTDGGSTWTFVGLRDSGQVGDLVVHPANPDLVYVAALGHPFGHSRERGVFRSANGGATWENVLFVSERTGSVDLAMDPANPRRIFAAMWTGERKPWTILSGSAESGLYRTDDGGDSWTKVTTGLPSGLVGKIAVEVSPADSSRVYALIEAPGDARGLYRSEDGGHSFRQVSAKKDLTYRPFYYTHLTADPANADKLWVNNETLWLTVDGGKTFSAVSTPHGDNHAMWIHPRDPDLMIQGNDGGANVSRDGGRTWSPQWNQPTAELYQVEVDSRFPYRVYGAQQDNSTITVPSKVSRRPIDPKQDWYAVSGCETGPVVPDPRDPDIVYGGCKGRHSVYNHRTGQTQEYWVYPHFNYGHDTKEMTYRFQRTAPMIVSPHDPGVIYHGSHVLHRTRDQGRTWEVISPDLTANQPEHQMYSGGPITHDITGEEIYSTIYAIAESPHRAGVLWVGANDGPIHISLDGGEEWRDITPADLPPGGRVNRIDPSPHVPGRAYVAVYRFQLDDWQPYVYRADDFGRTWQRLTDGANGIPADEPVRVVREDPAREGLLYAGTEFGVYVSVDGGGHWQSLQRNLPAVPVTDIKVHDGDLVLSTMGRSFWILDDLSPLRQLDPTVLAQPHHLFAPAVAVRARWVGSLERSFPGYAPEYPSMGAVIDYAFSEAVEDDAAVEILDQEGRVVRRFVAQASDDAGDEDQGMRGPREGSRSPRLSTAAGAHRLVWDLRHEGPRGRIGRFGSRGPIVAPGEFTVRLVIGGWSQERALSVVIDPRLEPEGVTVDDLRAQEQLAIEVRDGIDQLIAAAERAVKLHDRIEDRIDQVREGGFDGAGEVVAEGERIASRLEQIEKALRQTEVGKVGAELEPQLLGQLTYLYGMITAADQRPGRDAFVRWSDVRRELDTELEALEVAIDGEIAAWNEELVTLGAGGVVGGG